MPRSLRSASCCLEDRSTTHVTEHLHSQGSELKEPFGRDLTIVGGCGRVGLPLGIAFADTGLSTTLLDIDEEAVGTVNRGHLPFMEPGAAEVLARVVGSGLLGATTDPAAVADAEIVVVALGLPGDLDPQAEPASLIEAMAGWRHHLRDGQLLILRSTVLPGVTALIEEEISSARVDVEVAFCPERIAEGRAMVELNELPQIVASRSESGAARSARLFKRLTPTTVRLTPEEAELAKLFTNTWRYLKFAAANELFMIANDRGIDYDRVRCSLAIDYPRAADMPPAGFSSGPCLHKDATRLACFSGMSAMAEAATAVNEGLPGYVVARLAERHDLSSMTIGILGMAFKAESDDVRNSLSYDLKRILEGCAQSVLTTDPYVMADPQLEPLEYVLEASDLVIIAAPHRQYALFDASIPVVDIWNLRGKGALI